MLNIFTFESATSSTSACDPGLGTAVHLDPGLSDQYSTSTKQPGNLVNMNLVEDYILCVQEVLSILSSNFLWTRLLGQALHVKIEREKSSLLTPLRLFSTNSFRNYNEWEYLQNENTLELTPGIPALGTRISWSPRTWPTSGKNLQNQGKALKLNLCLLVRHHKFNK